MINNLLNYDYNEENKSEYNDKCDTGTFGDKLNDSLLDQLIMKKNKKKSHKKTKSCNNDIKLDTKCYKKDNIIFIKHIKGRDGRDGKDGKDGKNGKRGKEGKRGKRGKKCKKSLKWMGIWNNEKEYNEDNLVYHNGSTYIALVDNIGIEPNKCNNTFWELVVTNGINWKDNWDPMILYEIGDIVNFNNKLYICIICNINTSPFNYSTNEISSSWNLFIEPINKIFLQCVNFNTQIIPPNTNLIFENNINNNSNDIIYDNITDEFIIKKSGYYHINFNLLTDVQDELKMYIDGNLINYNYSIKSQDNIYFNILNYNGYININSRLYVRNLNPINNVNIVNNINNVNIYLYINEI